MLAYSASAISVEVIDLVSDTSTIYKSGNSAAKTIGCSVSAIMYRIYSSQVKPYKGRFIIKRPVLNKRII